MSTTSSFPVWREVLDQIDQALAHSLEVAVELPPIVPEAPGSPPPFEKIDECLGMLQTCLDRARRQAGTADAAMDGEIDALQGWLEAARSARQGLPTAS